MKKRSFETLAAVMIAFENQERAPPLETAVGAKIPFAPL